MGARKNGRPRGILARPFFLATQATLTVDLD